MAISYHHPRFREYTRVCRKCRRYFRSLYKWGRVCPKCKRNGKNYIKDATPDFDKGRSHLSLKTPSGQGLNPQSLTLTAHNQQQKVRKHGNNEIRD
jgi:protein-arginine kinase activator protein McsA